MKLSKTGLVAIAALAASASLSQAVVLISSIGTTDGSATTIGIGVRSGKAMNFVMAAGDDYSFDSARLSLSGATLTELNNLNIGLWSNETGTTPIASELVSLSYAGTSSGNIYDFTPDSSFTLEAETTYWLVLERYDETGSVAWESFTEPATGTIASSTARIFPSGSGQTADPVTWQTTSGVFNAVEINGTVIPEPGAYALLAGLTGLSFVMLRRRRS